MSIAITPRVGINARRSDDALQAENALLLKIADWVRPGYLPPNNERSRLRAGGLIESYRHTTLSKHKSSYWRLTDAGRARVAAIRAREKTQ